MNIVKLKDMIMPTNMSQANFFNKHLKGKYAYWVHMRYIVPFEKMSSEGYVACEEDITKLLKQEGVYPYPYGTEYLDVYDDDVVKFVDAVETDKINNTTIFRMKNSYTPDDNITVDELKLFRTWLANELLKMDQSEIGEQKNTYFTDSETHVLQYYANNMYNQVIKNLMEFGNVQVTYELLSKSSCGCHQNTNLSSLYNTELTTCDPISIYKKNVYNKMVEMFSNIDFWTQWPSEFINEVKRYIDNIIKCDFTLTNTTWLNEFLDCTCESTSKQEEYMEILKKLSQSLGYIRDGQTQGRQNYITDALHNWAQLLYEKMQW